MSVMVSAWFYWALFFVFTFFLTIYGSAVSFDAELRSGANLRPEVAAELRSGCEPFGSRANLRPSVAAELRSGCEPFGSRANFVCSRRSDSYIDIFFRVSSIALLPSLYAASQAWYDASRRVDRRSYTPRSIYPEHPADTAQSTTPTDEFVI